MNRVSDAMRRAGQIDEQQTAPADGMPFPSAEDPSEAPVIYPRPEVPRADVQLAQTCSLARTCTLLRKSIRRTRSIRWCEATTGFRVR